MTEYTPPTNFDFGAATLQGFKLPGGKSYLIRVAAWTAILITIVYVALGAPVVRAYVELFQNFYEMELNLDGSAPDNEVVLAVMAPMFRAMGVMFLIGFLQIAVFAAAETAIYRNLFHNEDRGFFPLTFGMDELRVLGTRIVVGFILGGIYLLMFLLYAVMGMIGVAGSGVLAALGGLLTFFITLAAIAGFIWSAVRLAPSSAYSVKLRAFNPIASWAPMRGQVWSAIGGYLILYLVGYFIVGFILMIVFMLLFMSSGILGVLMKIDDTTGELPDFSPVWEHLTSAGFIIPLIIAILISMFLSMIWYGMIWSMWGYFAKDEKEPEYWKPEKNDDPDLSKSL